MGLLEIVQDSLKTVDKAVIDQDLKNQLQHDIVMKYADVMFKGPGSKITKWTLCFLVISVVWAILGRWLMGGEMAGVFQVAGACTSVIALMTGGLVVGTSQKRKWNAIANGNGKPRSVRPPESYRPDYPQPPVGSATDGQPSDTKRDHPGR